MTTSRHIETMERTAYRQSFSDGIIDLFLGVSLLWMGAVWVLLPDFGGLAGIVPAVLAPLMVVFRKQFVQERGGYVRWSRPRRSSERRRLILILGAGVLVFVAALVILASSTSGPMLTAVAPALISWLLALLTMGLAGLLGSGRFLLYAAVLVVAGLLTALQDANPGWPLLAAGAVAGALGATLLVRFTAANPIPEDE